MRVLTPRLPAVNCLPVETITVRNRIIPVRGLLTALGGFIVLLSFAIQYSYSNLNTYITSYLRTTGYNPGQSYADFIFLTGVNGIASGILSPFFGALARKLGAKRSILLGSFIYSLGFVLTFVTIKYHYPLVILTLTMHGVGVPFVYSTAVGAAQKWFPPEVRGFVGSLVVSGYGFGSLIWIPIQTSFVNPDNIKATFDSECLLAANITGSSKTSCDRYFTDPRVLERIPHMFLLLGGVYFLFGLVAFVLISEPPPHFQPGATQIMEMKPSDQKEAPNMNIENGSGDLSAASTIDLSPMQVLRTKNFFLLWFCFLVIMFTNAMFVNYSKTFGLSYINDDHFFSKVGIISNVLNGASRIGWGLVYDRIKFRGCYLIMGTIVIIITATFPLLPFIGAESLGAKVAYGVWMCLIYSATPCIFSTTAAVMCDMFGKTHFQANYGLLFTENVVFTAILIIITKVPVIFSSLSYEGMFGVGAGVTLLGVVAATFLPSQGVTLCGCCSRSSRTITPK